MSRSRVPLFLGLGAATGVGYYLYNSGGNARVAEKQFESEFFALLARHNLAYRAGVPRRHPIA